MDKITLIFVFNATILLIILLPHLKKLIKLTLNLFRTKFKTSSVKERIKLTHGVANGRANSEIDEIEEIEIIDESYLSKEEYYSLRFALEEQRKLNKLLFSLTKEELEDEIFVRQVIEYVFREKPLIMRLMMEPTIIVSGISAVLQSVQIWMQYRDRKRAGGAFQSKYQSSLTDVGVIQEANELALIVPRDILHTMMQRAQKCWERYSLVLNGDYLPAEIDEATEAVKKCICRELKRVIDLNGSIPKGTLRLAWEQYCAMKN